MTKWQKWAKNEEIGVMQAKLDLVDVKLEALKNASGSKDLSYTDRSATRVALTKLFEKTDALLNEEADMLVEVMKETQPDFYNQYFAARVIKDLGGSHTKPGEEDKTPPPTDTPTPPVQ